MENVKSKHKKSNKNGTGKKGFSAFIIIAAIIIILLIVFTAAQKLGNMTVTAMVSDVKSYFMSLGAGDGYPYSIKADEVKGMTINNKNVVLLLNDKTTTLTPTAKEIMPTNHKYSNPVMKQNGSKIIVYDLDSGKFRVQSGSDITKEYELDNKIMAAAIGADGNYAVASYGDDVQSVLTVYSKRHKKDFIWNFKNERVVDIALSDNGKYAAVAVLNYSDAKVYSKLYVFNFTSEDYEACFEYKNSILVKVDYVRGENIIAVGNNIRSYINSKMKKTDLSFGSDELHNYCMADNGVSAQITSRYGSSLLSTLTVYSNKNAAEYTVDFDHEVKWVDTDGKYTAVLFDKEIKTYNKKGEQIGDIAFDGEPVRVEIDGTKVYLLTLVGIECFNTKDDTAESR
ncbi:MAG: DUF5711 family protein [Clostridia bacterium]|nr:DUF5711 family protein [Clostridia bacterium]